MKKKKFYSQLAEVCRYLHIGLHGNLSKHSLVGSYQKELETLIEQISNKIPKTIIRQEALALYNKLRSNLQAAIIYRKRQIVLMEELHASVWQGAADGLYDVEIAKKLLQGWDEKDLLERQKILQKLESQLKEKS